MSNNKKSKLLSKIFIVIVLIVILGLIGYLVYDLFFNDDMIEENGVTFKRYTELVLTDEECSTGSIITKVENGNIIFLKDDKKSTLEIGNVKYLYKANGANTSCNKFTLFYLTEDNKLYLIKNPLSKILNSKKTKFKAETFITDDFGSNLELLSSNILDFVGDTSRVISDTTFYFVSVMNTDGKLEQISY